MRSLKSRLFGFGVAAFLGTIVVVGCSASGEDPGSDTDSTEPEEAGKTIDNADDDDDDDGTATSTKKDAGKKDAGKDASKDAAKDAAPAAPEPGDKCPTADVIFKRSCGMCGTQEAFCIPNPKGSGNIVDQYGLCSGEKTGGCVPGATEEVACGNCGTQKRTCDKYCAWTTTGCTGQPTNSCSPGAVELKTASCTVANTYRQRSCANTCTWNAFTTTCEPPPSFLVAPPTAGGVSSTILVLSSTQTVTKLPINTCPMSSTVTFGSTVTPYAYIEVRNPNPKAVTVSVYNSQAPGGNVLDTVIAAYDGTTPPGNNDVNARKQCKGEVSDYGTTSLTGNSSFASIDSPGITIPANSSIMVYTAAYYAYNANSPNSSTGMIMLNVKTESVAP